jgi:hypothetical protein
MHWFGGRDTRNTYMEEPEHPEEGEGETIKGGCVGGMHPKPDYRSGTTSLANEVRIMHGSFKRSSSCGNLHVV